MGANGSCRLSRRRRRRGENPSSLQFYYRVDQLAPWPSSTSAFATRTAGCILSLELAVKYHQLLPIFAAAQFPPGMPLSER
jgi:hypothetical protein